MSAYEKLRQKNLEDNRRILAEIGLSNPFKKQPAVRLKKGIKRKADSDDFPRERPKKAFAVEDLDSSGSLRGTRRRSARLTGKDAPTDEELKEEVEQWEEENDTPKRVAAHRPNFYGAIPDVEVGTVWMTRMEACRAGVQRPTVAGIHGGPDGAYSIALSGGYDDNIDLGEGFTYTGEGGRDLKGTKSNPKNLRTAPQSKDQELSRGNLALSRSVETGNPVRVIRGYKLDSAFAPEEGYRYDGLYRVERAWYGTGTSGFGVWRFALRRLEDQAPPPWTYADADAENDKSPSKQNPDKSDDVSDVGTDSGRSDSGFDSESVGGISSSQGSDVSSVVNNEDSKHEEESVTRGSKNGNEEALEKEESSGKEKPGESESGDVDQSENGDIDQSEDGVMSGDKIEEANNNMNNNESDVIKKNKGGQKEKVESGDVLKDCTNLKGKPEMKETDKTQGNPEPDTAVDR